MSSAANRPKPRDPVCGQPHHSFKFTHPGHLCGLALSSRQTLVSAAVSTRALGAADVAHYKVDAVVATAIVGVAVAHCAVAVRRDLCALDKLV